MVTSVIHNVHFALPITSLTEVLYALHTTHGVHPVIITV